MIEFAWVGRSNCIEQAVCVYFRLVKEMLNYFRRIRHTSARRTWTRNRHPPAEPRKVRIASLPSPHVRHYRLFWSKLYTHCKIKENLLCESSAYLFKLFSTRSQHTAIKIINISFLPAVLQGGPAEAEQRLGSVETLFIYSYGSLQYIF